MIILWSDELVYHLAHSNDFWVHTFAFGTVAKVFSCRLCKYLALADGSWFWDTFLHKNRSGRNAWLIIDPARSFVISGQDCGPGECQWDVLSKSAR